MKAYDTSHIRNVVLLAHVGTGKTSLAEAIAHSAGVTTRLGKVEDGSTISDFDPDEARRHMSISLSVVPVEWKGVKINLLDAPGYSEFVGEMKGGAAAADWASTSAVRASRLTVRRPTWTFGWAWPLERRTMAWMRATSSSRLKGFVR